MQLFELVKMAIIAALGPAVVAIGVSSIFHPVSTDRMQTSNGARTFKTMCAGCHGLDATSQRLGPSLKGIGDAAGNRVPGMNSTQYLAESILYPANYKAGDGVMPGGLADSLTRKDFLSLIAFLQSQGGRPDYAALRALDFTSDGGASGSSYDSIATINLVEVEAGRKLFFGKYQCGECHCIENIPGRSLLAPRLAGVGYYEEELLKESIRHPEKRIAKAYQDYTLLLDDGRVLTGRMLKESDEEITILTINADGISKRSLSADSVDEIVVSTVSSMPNWPYMSEKELDQLVAFLTTLR